MGRGHFLLAFSIIAVAISIADAENRREYRLLRSRGRSHRQDIFDDQALAGNHRPGRLIQVPIGESRFKPSRSQQKFTEDGLPHAASWLDSEDGESGPEYYEGNNHGMNSGNYEQSNSIPEGDSRMWIDSKMNYPNIACHCETYLGGVYVLPLNNIPIGSPFPYQRPYDPENSVYGQPETYKAGFSSPHKPLRARPSGMKPKKNHHRHEGSRRPKELQTSKLKKTPIHSNLFKFTTEAPTKDFRPDAVIKILA